MNVVTWKKLFDRNFPGSEILEEIETDYGYELKLHASFLGKTLCYKYPKKLIETAVALFNRNNWYLSDFYYYTFNDTADFKMEFRNDAKLSNPLLIVDFTQSILTGGHLYFSINTVPLNKPDRSYLLGIVDFLENWVVNDTKWRLKFMTSSLEIKEDISIRTVRKKVESERIV